MTGDRLIDWADAMAATVGRSAAPPCRYTGWILDAETLAAAGRGIAGPVFAWTGDGRGFFVQTAPTRLARVDPRPGRSWSRDLAGVLPEALDLALSGDDRLVAVAAHNDDATIAVLDADSGDVVAVIAGGQGLAFAPGGGFLLATADPADPREPGVLLFDRRDCDAVVRRPCRSGIGRLAWSPDGALLGAAGRGGIVTWRAPLWRRAFLPAPDDGALFARVAWSPDGRRIAATPGGSRSGAVTVWADGVPYRTFGDAGGRFWAPALAWSPDSAALAFPGRGGDVQVWDPVRAEAVVAIPAPRSGAEVWTVRWSPDGDRLAVTYTGGLLVVYRLGRASAPEPVAPAAPADPELLAELGAVVGGLGAAVALSTLGALLTALGPGGADDLAGRGRGADRLRGLGWPAPALVGVAALVAGYLTGGAAYRAPGGYGPDRLRDRLRQALGGHVVAPVAAPFDEREVAAAFDTAADRHLGLLTRLGSRVVADEPALPTRLAGLPPLPPLPEQYRPLLELHPAGGAGASAQAAVGPDRSGVARRGRPEHLLRWQLALDDDVFDARFAGGQLTYRTSRSRAAPHDPPLVLALDDSPAAFGRVGATLRLVAHALAAERLRRGHRVTLVRMAAPARVEQLATAADLVQLWTGWRIEPADAEAAVALGGLSAVVVVLTHAFQAVPRRPGLQVVRVPYPGSSFVLDGAYSVECDPSPASLRALLSALC